MKKFLNFETLITPAIIKILYPVLVILFAIRYFWQMVAGVLAFAFGGLGTAFTALVSFVAMPFVLRIVFEVVLVLFRIYEHTFKLANPDKELTGVLNSTDELKKEMNAGRPQPQQPNYQQQPGYGYGQNPYPPQQPGYPQPGPNQPGYPNQGQPNPYPNQGFAPQQQAPQAQPQQPQPAAPNTPANPNNPQ